VHVKETPPREGRRAGPGEQMARDKVWGAESRRGGRLARRVYASPIGVKV